jgi:hypothetical protein
MLDRNDDETDETLDRLGFEGYGRRVSVRVGGVESVPQ